MELESIKEVKAPKPAAKVDTKVELADKLDKGYQYVNIPGEDIYNYKFDGIWINGNHYLPGKHLVDPETAGELERILAVWQRENVRAMRPQADIKSLQQTGNVNVTN